MASETATSRTEADAGPVLILQFMADDAPAYLGTWLQRQGLAFDLRLADAATPFPQRIAGYRALALLGGSMSVNDELPFLRTAERLIVQAMQADVPVLGHCLGGQLMAKALGAKVGASPAPEVGWHRMDCIASMASAAWFGPQSSHQVFQWHYEAFDLPPNAVRLATSAACPNQAFALGHHLALQFHLEVDEAKVALWLDQHDAQYRAAQATSATVLSESVVRDGTAAWLQPQQRLADRVYSRWLGIAPIPR